MRYLVAAAAFVACATPPEGQPVEGGPVPAQPALQTVQGAIMGGYDDDTSTAVFGMASLSGWGFGTCTGSLIAPNVVLTARHCVAPVLDEAASGGVDCSKTRFGKTNNPVSLYVTPDAIMTRWGNYYGAVEVRVPEESSFCGNDVALIILSENVPASVAVPLVPRVDEPVAGLIEKPNGADVYSAVGYGESADGNNQSGRRRRRDNLTATCNGPKCPWYSSAADAEWLGQTGICSGDSGGPALDAAGRVIGVVSRGPAGCQSPIYGSVAAWKDLITSTVVDAAKLGKYAAPVWTTGFPTNPVFQYSAGMPCVTGDDCSSGICYEGYCTRQCSAEAFCAEPFVCHPELSICTQRQPGGACAADGDCASGFCIDGLCSAACRPSGLPCPTGWSCGEVKGRIQPEYTTGFCLPAPVGLACGGTTDCAGGKCVNGACTRRCDTDFPCPTGFGCDGAGQCTLPGVGELCTSDAQCNGGICDNGACTRTCTATSGCPATHRCGENGLCEPVPFGQSCAVDADCNGGACEDGACTGACEHDGDCLEGYVCDQGTSVCTLAEAGNACAIDGDCPGGSCVNGACTRPCGDAAPCGAGFLCGESSHRCELIPEAAASSGCSSGPGRSAPWAAGLAGLALLGLALARRRAARPPLS